MAMEARVNEGAPRSVEVTGGEGGFYKVKVGDHIYQVDAAELEGRVLHLLIDGKARQVSITPVEGGFDVGLRGRVLNTQLADPHKTAVKRAAAAAGGGATTISSPMPGKVIRVPATPGMQVKKGQPLVVVEAMKMENEYKAPREGTVASVHVKEGDTIEAGARLVVLGPA